MSELKRWAALGLMAMPVGYLAERLTSLVPAPDGGPDATMLVNASLPLGVACTLGAVALAALTGIAIAGAVGARTGLFGAGIVLGWASAGSATVTGLIRTAQSGDPLRMLALESAILALAVAGVAWLIVKLGKKDHLDEQDAVLSAQSAIGLVCALVLGAAGAWLVAREGLKGQTIAAGVAAGMAGSVVARVVAMRSHVAAIVLGLCLIGVVAPLAAMWTAQGGLLEASYANTLFRPALLSPLDWCAGALAGLPIGASWAASMLEKRIRQDHES